MGLFHAQKRSRSSDRREIVEKVVFSVQELATQLGISLPKAYELVKRPGFPVLRIGSRFLIPKEAFWDWLMEQTVEEGGE